MSDPQFREKAALQDMKVCITATALSRPELDDDRIVEDSIRILH
jgi:hypothetical protein